MKIEFGLNDSMRFGRIGTPISGGYTPLQEGSVNFWYDFSNIVGLVNNDPITIVADKSGNGRTLTGDATKQPLYKTNILNGLAGGLFDAINDALYSSSFAWGSNKATVYYLFSGIASGSDRCLIEFGNATTDNDSWLLYRQNTGDKLVGLIRNNAKLANSISVQAIATAAYLITVVYDLTVTNKVMLYINGVNEGTHGDAGVTTDNFGSKVLNLGGRSNGTSMPASHYIHEAIGYAAAHDADTRQRVIDYIVAKWAGPPFS